eukprot:scaffold3680_cov381-Prasinococcus_capsulatus_cf.AAC.4
MAGRIGPDARTTSAASPGRCLFPRRRRAAFAAVGLGTTAGVLGRHQPIGPAMGNCFSTADEGLPRSKANHATSTTGLGGAGTARSARAVLDKHKALIESSSGKGAAWILLNKLDAEGQSHLFSTWPALGSQDESKLQLIEQLLQLDATYSSGGLLGYLQNAKLLLQESREGKNPFDGFAPSVPHGCNLKYGDKDFMEHEGMGMDEVSKAGFVLVAGGLGERLGYSGIKVALPTCLLTNVCFLEYYIQNIIAMQKDGAQIPLAIMTSGDTHEKTKTLLEENSFFGMAESQITLIKQEKVACLIDNDANLALDPKDRFRVQTKPHGHGDVHALMHSSGLAKKWQAAGTKWVIFFQDTNVLVFKAIPAALGVSKQQDYEVNSLAVPRRAKEAIGTGSRIEFPPCTRGAMILADRRCFYRSHHYIDKGQRREDDD